MRQNVVYPRLITNQSFVEKYLEGLNISRDGYFRNVLNIQLFDDLKCVEKMYDDPEKSSWRKSSFVIVVNAFYQPKTNRMSFPAAFLQGNMFNSRLPLYVNYGGVGSIVGHEITHGFDDNGRKFDHTGSKRDWWDPQTLASFINRTQCMRKQYGAYMVEEVGKKVNGKLTLGENIADNGGMKINYLGYGMPQNILDQNMGKLAKKSLGIRAHPEGARRGVRAAAAWPGALRAQADVLDQPRTHVLLQGHAEVSKR